ncbi:MAG: SWIM zinc finger family protein [Candidatus Bathyarchaeia archaeon]
MPLDRIIEKAYELIRGRRIEQISEDSYNVIGDHGTYIVTRKIDGTVTCNCPGFLSKKRCSHSLAVIMLNQPSLLKSIKREIERKERGQKAKR